MLEKTVTFHHCVRHDWSLDSINANNLRYDAEVLEMSWNLFVCRRWWPVWYVNITPHLWSLILLIMCVLFQTAERIATGQTAPRPASARTEHNAIDATAAAAACTAGSDSPVRKVDIWLTYMHPCCLNSYLPSSLHPHRQQVTSFTDSRVRAEETF